MRRCMRTTIQLDEQLLAEAKRYALESGRTLTEFIEDALRQSLAQRRRTEERGRIRLTTFAGNGLQPGVDIDDSAGLREPMDER